MIIVFVCVIGVIVIPPIVFLVWMHAFPVYAGNADALIVLGYRCDQDRIHPLLKDRLDSALWLFNRFHYRYIILSGGAVASTMTEAEIMRDYLIAHGVDAKRIIMEIHSRNTVQNLVNCKILLKQYRLNTCLLVSNAFHIRRMIAFARALELPAAFYAKRTLVGFFSQMMLTFEEIKAYRLTAPGLEKVLRKPLQMMGVGEGQPNANRKNNE